MRKILLGALAGAIVALAPAVAQADSIVYLKGGEVWAANADGTGARQVTSGANNWAWPSQADDGTLVVAGGAAHDTYGPAGSDLYKFKADGTQIGAPIPTWGSTYSASCPTSAPSGVRVAPDATKIAYSTLYCTQQDPTTLWTAIDATAAPATAPNDEGFVDPAWIDGSQYIVSDSGAPVDPATQARFYIQATSANPLAGPGWLDPIGDAREQGVVSRTGTSLAVLADDGPNQWNGLPTAVAIYFYRASSLASAESTGWSDICKMNLDASVTPRPDLASPSFSPDGTKLIWGDQHGVEAAALPTAADNAGNCTNSPALLISDASTTSPEPYYSKADVYQPPVTGTNPDPTPTGDSGGTTQAPAQPTQPSPSPTPVVPATVVKLVAKFTVKGKVLRARHRISFDASKSTASGTRIVSWSWSFGDRKKAKGKRVTHAFRKRGKYRVTLVVRDAAGHSAKVIRTLRIR